MPIFNPVPLTIPLGGTGANSLATAPFAVLSPASQQTGTLNVSGAITSGSSIVAGTSTAPSVTAGDLAASRSVSTGEIHIGGSTTNVTLDLGITLSNSLTSSAPLYAAGGSNIYTTLGANPAGSSSPTTYAGIWYDLTNSILRMEALSGGVAWRNVVLAYGGGNVGIKTLAPSYALDVTGTGHYTGSLTLDSGATIGSSQSITFTSGGTIGGDGATDIVIYPSATAGVVVFRDYTDSTDNVRIPSGGGLIMSRGAITAGSSTYGPTSATVAGTLELPPTGTATSGTNYASNIIQFNNSVWNGSASVSNNETITFSTSNILTLSGPLAITGALTGATTGAFSGQVTASSLSTGSGNTVYNSGQIGGTGGSLQLTGATSSYVRFYLGSTATNFGVLDMYTSAGNITEIFGGGTTVAGVIGTELNIDRFGGSTYFALDSSGDVGHSGYVAALSYIVAGQATAPTLTAGDLGASRSASTGVLKLGGSTSSGQLDFGVTNSGSFTLNQNLVGTGTITGLYFSSKANGSTSGYVPPVFTNGGVATANTEHIVRGTASGSSTGGTASVTVSLTGSAQFTSSSSYYVIATGNTVIGTQNVTAINVVSKTATSFGLQLTGTGGSGFTLAVDYIAIGY